MATYNFTGKLVLVTGAASGIGQATAIAFANAGAKVVAADINLKGAQETLDLLKGGGHTAVQVDVSDHQSVENLSETIISKYGHSPSTVIHSAAIIYGLPRRTIFDIKPEEWDHVIDVNLKGTFLINQKFGGRMRDEKIENGSIVNFSSVNARLAFPVWADYSATKSGINSLTRNFAAELGPYGIRVNAVEPGAIATPMQEKVDKAAADAFVATVPLRRYGTPEEVAKFCMFLASTDSSYITGVVLGITGGI